MSLDDPDDINFWPAFTDSMLAVILVLLLVLGVAYLEVGQRIKQAQDCQSQFATGIPGITTGDHPNVWVVPDHAGRDALITLRQDDRDNLLLHVTFSDSVLGFLDCDDNLSPKGEYYIRQIGDRIRKQQDSIVEIQIQGHADKKPTNNCRRFDDNLHLASARADRVFQRLEAMGISPYEHAMSAVSYGEYFPANRKMGEPYTMEKWAAANAGPVLMQKNRRVELNLRYGTNMKGCTVSK